MTSSSLLGTRARAILPTALLLCAVSSSAAEKTRPEPPGTPFRLFADSNFSVYERAVINLANLAIDARRPEEAVHLLETLLKTGPTPDVASVLRLHLFRIRSKLLNDDDAAMKDAALVGPTHIPQVLRELTWGLERENQWAQILDVFLRLLPEIKDAEARVVTAEWLLARMDRSGDDDLRRRAAQAVIDHVSPEDARAVTLKRIEERRDMMELRRQQREYERDIETRDRLPVRRTEAPHSPPPRGAEDVPAIPGF